jgi:hypothetical protein
MESKVPFRVKMESLQKTSGGIFSGKFYYGAPGAGVGFGRFPANTSTPQGRSKAYYSNNTTVSSKACISRKRMTTNFSTASILLQQQRKMSSENSIPAPSLVLQTQCIFNLKRLVNLCCILQLLLFV